MKLKNRHLQIAFLLACIIFLTSNSLLLNSFAFEVDRTGTVYNIVDGDTIDVYSIGRIRLADIDTPEQGEPGDVEATNYLSSLIYQKTVYIDVDDVYGTDVYGRIVAVVYVYYDASHLKNVNKALLDSGHAVIWNFDNEFNPYTWTLLVDYPLEDPPPDDPPLDDPLPSGCIPNSQWISIIGIASIVTGSSAAIGVYAYKYIVPKRKKTLKFQSKPKKSTQAIKRKNQFGKILKTPSSKSNMKMVKDIRSVDKHLNIRGTVNKINAIHDFTRKDGSSGKVGSFRLSDATGSIKVVLWDEKTSILNFNNFKLGSSVNIKNAYCKMNLYT
ncbi:MAG: thermonuclease family protein, partial [Candidatus Lokiarchaeota archaeon]|nr:thermonuclease family protein [Candidatus Lokiarchaeota archaeon]